MGARACPSFDELLNAIDMGFYITACVDCEAGIEVEGPITAEQADLISSKMMQLGMLWLVENPHDQRLITVDIPNGVYWCREDATTTSFFVGE